MGKVMMCPKCGHGVETPHKYQVSAWRRLRCQNCKAKLEPVYSRAPLLIAQLGMVPSAFFPAMRLFGFRPGLFWIGFAFGVFIAALIAVGIFWLWESRHPRLKIGKERKPEIVLNLNLKSPENIKNLQ
jgi:prepilin signal peptidase PulO-like enzyme (type II secretory pathway)